MRESCGVFCCRADVKRADVQLANWLGELLRSIYR